MEGHNLTIFPFQSRGSCPGDGPTERGPVDCEHLGPRRGCSQTEGMDSTDAQRWRRGLQKVMGVHSSVPREPHKRLFCRELIRSLAQAPEMSLCSRSTGGLGQTHLSPHVSLIHSYTQQMIIAFTIWHQNR